MIHRQIRVISAKEPLPAVGKGVGIPSHEGFSSKKVLTLSNNHHHPVSKARAMGMMKNYVLTLLQECSEEQFGQDAVEWAIVAGHVRLSYERNADVRSIMLRYDEIIEAYRRSKTQANEELRQAAAPMKRATPRRQIKVEGSGASIKRKNAA